MPKISAVPIVLCVVSILAASASPLFSQDKSAQAKSSMPQRNQSFAVNVPNVNRQVLTNPERGINPQSMTIPVPPDTFHMALTLDWTNCQIHRAGDDSPIEILLTGSINSDAANLWTLTAADNLFGNNPALRFVEDAFGRTNSSYGSDIALMWEISVDGGTFAPMTIGLNNELTAIFSPGIHTFQVRITGNLQVHQDDGYYRLELEQSLTPQL